MVKQILTHALVACATAFAPLVATAQSASSPYADEDADKYGYLYAHMHRSKEYTCYALGTDGTTFDDLFGGGAVIDNSKFTATGGMRDAYVTRTQSGKFMLAATDMTSSLGWTSNHIMVLMLSNDLVHWDKSLSIDLESEENLKALGGITADEMTAAWAPEVIYDPVTKKYVVYYSVGFASDRHRIYYSLVDEDLTEISEPKLYFDPGYDIIDADIVYNAVDEQYVMFYKSEYASGTGAHSFYKATATTLVPDEGATGTCQWTADNNPIVSYSGESIEAPSLFRLIGSNTWRLAIQKYSGTYEYRLLDLDEHCDNTGAAYTVIKGSVAPQHGSFLTLTEREYTHLQTWEKVTDLLKKAKTIQEGLSSDALSLSIAQAEKALSESGTFDEEYLSMQRAYDLLTTAVEGATEEMRESAYGGTLTDLTPLLVNADFAAASTGWYGTAFTAANGNVAEQYNKTFDFYQIVTGLPIGKYRVEVQGFYRAGANDVAYAAHTAGTETINALLYANDASTAMKSLYSEDGYTYSPSYTYPNGVGGANTAFNTNDQYHNSLEVTVTDGLLKLGIKSSKKIDSDWCCFDNFKLTYLGYDKATAYDALETANDKLKAYKAIYDTEHYPDAVSLTSLDDYYLDDIISGKTESKDFAALLAGDIRSLLSQAVKTFQLCGADKTSKLTNPTLAQGATGWDGASSLTFDGTYTNAEAYQKTFDISQELTGLPNGEYEVAVQAMQRVAGNDAAFKLHEAGTENITTQLYANGQSVAVRSPFDFCMDEPADYTEHPDYIQQGWFFPNGLKGFKTACDLGGYWNVVKATVTDGTLKLGLKCDEARESAYWTAFDNFRLSAVSYVFDQDKACPADGTQGIGADLVRTLRSDCWNTLCLPFSVGASQLAEVLGEGLKLMAYKGYEGTTLHFEPATAIKGGRAYLVRPAKTVTNPHFDDINVLTTESIETGVFQGVWEPTTLKTDGSQLFITADGYARIPAEATNVMPGLRAYINVPENIDAKQLSLDIDGQLTGIEAIEAAQSPTSPAYNLAGQRVGTPKAKGIYIYKGKKIAR